MEATSLAITIFSGLAGALGLVAFIDTLRIAIRRYRRHVDEDIHTDLRAQFIDLSRRQLFTLASALALFFYISAQFLLPTPLAIGFALLGLTAPKLMLRLIEKRRRQAVIAQLPEALQALACALRAGVNLNKGLEQLARRQPRPLSEEFALVLSRQRLGESLEASLEEMAERIQGEEIGLFKNAVSISHRVGGDLADTLERLSVTLRERAQMEARIQALTAMGRMQGRVMCVLPIAIAAVLYLQQPQMMQRLAYEPLGWAVIALASVMMLLAFISIRRIVAIDV